MELIEQRQIAVEGGGSDIKGFGTHTSEEGYQTVL